MTPSVEHIRALASQGFNLIPVWQERLADTETPVSAHLRLLEGEQPEQSFLLESVAGLERVARWSFLGRDPHLVFRSRGKRWEISGSRTLSGDGDPLSALRSLLDDFRPHQPDGLPALAAAVGFVAYDAVRLVEDIPDTGREEIPLDDLCFGFYREGLVFDNRRHRMLLWAFVDLSHGASPEKALEDAIKRISTLEGRLDSPLPPSHLTVAREPGEMRSNFRCEEFLASVERCKEYIRAGDAFQIVLSQRLSVDPGCSSLDIYRMLRVINPSPYMFHLRMGSVEVAGASPEMLVEVKDGRATTRPIAGTRPRGLSEADDLRLERELLADPKERAEHLMLVDLGRNDLGRVCTHGSVAPTDLFVVERYSHVMHIVSAIEGELAPGHDALDALFACFPAGTLSGAPKIRAMQIIDELEPTRRGLYGGAVCHLDLRGNLGSCIVIRTVVVHEGIAHVQAGAGIVHDSDPESEWKETLHKASAVVQAIRAAHRSHGDFGSIDRSIADGIS